MLWIGSAGSSAVEKVKGEVFAVENTERVVVNPVAENNYCAVTVAQRVVEQYVAMAEHEIAYFYGMVGLVVTAESD